MIDKLYDDLRIAENAMGNWKHEDEISAIVENVVTKLKALQSYLSEKELVMPDEDNVIRIFNNIELFHWKDGRWHNIDKMSDAWPEVISC